MTIEVNLKNGNNYVFKNVTSYSDLTFGPIWFWVEWEDTGRRYIAASEIQDILIQGSWQNQMSGRSTNE